MKLFEPQVLIILLIIVLIIFGPKQLPGLGKSIGETIGAIKRGLNEDDDAENPDAKPPVV